MSNVALISLNEAIELFSKTNSETVSVEILRPVAQIRSRQREVFKRTLSVYKTGFNGKSYAEMVNEQLAAEGKTDDPFVATSKSWREWVPNARGFFFQHKKSGEKYLQLYFRKAAKIVVTYQDALGNELSREDALKDALAKEKEPPSTREDYAKRHQGLEDPILVITPKLENICQIKLDNRKFRIV